MFVFNSSFLFFITTFKAGNFTPSLKISNCTIKKHFLFTFRTRLWMGHSSNVFCSHCIITHHLLLPGTRSTLPVILQQELLIHTL